MSKASQWARRAKEMRFRERLTAFQRRRRMIPLIAVVSERGDLVFPKHHGDESNRVRSCEALRFGRWLLKIFEEKS